MSRERRMGGVAFVAIRDTGPTYAGGKKAARKWAELYRRKGIKARVTTDNRGYNTVWVEKSKRARA